MPWKEHTVENDLGVKVDTILEETKDGEYKLTKHINDDVLEKENIEARKDLHDRKGFTKDRSMRWIGRIPWFLFMQEPLLKEYLDSKDENPEYAQKCIRTWLRMNVSRRIGEGSI